jgi:hypothetical protein
MSSNSPKGKLPKLKSHFFYENTFFPGIGKHKLCICTMLAAESNCVLREIGCRSDPQECAATCRTYPPTLVPKFFGSKGRLSGSSDEPIASAVFSLDPGARSVEEKFVPCLSGSHPRPLAGVFCRLSMRLAFPTPLLEVQHMFRDENPAAV